MGKVKRMTIQELDGIWNYYLSLESDLANTSRYIEPLGQEDVHSFEFSKLLILACTEIESVFKAICRNIEGSQTAGNMGQYKEAILGKYPKISEAIVSVARLGRTIKPFEDWTQGKLPWWDAYQQVKHNRGNAFGFATYKNATYAMAALYVSIFYLAETVGLRFPNYRSEYITSEYAPQHFLCRAPKKLPDFENDKT